MDQIDEVREWFFANPSTSLKDAADHFGLPYEKVRDWGKHNQWHTRRTLKRFEDIPEDVLEQAKILRGVIIEQATGDLSSSDLCDLVKAFNSLTMYEPKEEGIPRDLLDNFGESD